MNGAPLADAFRLLQRGQAAEALRIAAAIISSQPANARAQLAVAMALRALGRAEDAAAAFRRAAALDDRDYAPHFELGRLLETQGLAGEALAEYERAQRLRPDFVAIRLAIGLLRSRLHDWSGAAADLREVLRIEPGHVEALRALGQNCARRGDYGEAAAHFAAALAGAPGDPDLPMYLAQTLLLEGRWSEAWIAYARRDSRRDFEARSARAGRPYRVPPLGEIVAKDVMLVAEQGLGDILFFLRFAPALRAVARHISFSGEPRLASIIARTGTVDTSVEASPPHAVALLVADLPAMLGEAAGSYAPSLRASPQPSRVESWALRLRESGPRPWILATWRSGTPREVSREALRKIVPVDRLFEALRAIPGTVFALQRDIGSGELEAAAHALGRPVHDLSPATVDLEDCLAVASLADRHVGVSSTNMHLAALAGKTADVLVPFPPEWRWGAAGESPWFPGFRVHRQQPDGDWSRALAAIAQAD